MRIYRTGRCPHFTRLYCDVALYVLSTPRCIPTASFAVAVILTAAHPSPHSTHRRKARRAWPRLAWWLLDMCVINAFQLWSKGQHHPGQLRFREELMHELLKQLPPETTPRKHGAGLYPAHALASEHFSTHVEEDRDCAVCSRRSVCRVRTNYICSACNTHLCIGNCFAQYHA